MNYLLNRERLDKLMNEEGLDVVVASTPENVVYTSGFWSLGHWVLKGTQVYVVYPKDETKQPVLIMPESELDLFAHAPSWIGEFATYGKFIIEGIECTDLEEEEKRLRDYVRISDPAGSGPEALVRLIERLGLSNGRIGVDESNLSPQAFKWISEQLKGEVVPAYNFLQKVRMVKTEEEVRRLKKVASITELGMKAVMEAVEEGITEKQLYKIFENTVVQQGARPVLYCVAVGSHSAFPNAVPTERKIKKGDILRFDVGCIYKHYYSDTARICALGEPSDKHIKYYQTLVKGEQEAIRMIKPGVNASAVFNKAVEVVQQNGIPHYRRHHCGHGIGIEVYDPPLIAPNTTVELEENMVLNIETPYYELGFGGLQVEDTIVVTAKGYEYLTELPRDLIIL